MRNTFDATLTIYKKGCKQKIYKLYCLDVHDFTYIKNNTIKFNRDELIDLFIGYFDNTDITDAINQKNYKLKIY